MDGDRFRRVGEIFSRARRIDDPSAREAFVAEMCGDDAGLRAELVSLLRAHDRPERPRPDRHLVEDAVRQATRPETPWMPEEIAGFRIRGLLGVGGMGAVYEAEQRRPERTVALKVLRPDAASAELRGRFEREAAILARLQHTGIARVYEVGTTATPAGESPYIAMEPVDGVDLLRYAASRGLGLRARLDLLVEICAAVAHAHQHGVVHRDLKPGNILVTDAGEPKVLDFGVARPLDETVGRYTRENQVIGTIGYMSPEQIRTEDVDTRSDIYALGVLAYELLAGRHPHADDNGSLPTALRAILDKDPPPLGRDRRELRGDLTVIVDTAMAKERDRRYQSVSALAEDIRRYRASRPILARPPTTSYVVRKFVRRHKALVAGSVTTLLALVAGLVLALRAADREARERLRAERLAAEGQIAAVAGSLQRFDGQRAAERLDQIPERHRGWEWRYLRAAADRSSGFLPAPARRYACVVDDDGVLARRATPAVAARTLRGATSYRSPVADVIVRDARGEALLCVPQDHPPAVPFVHAGRRLRARLANYEILVEDAAGAEVARLRQRHVLRTIAVSADGSRLAVAGGGGKVLQVWEWANADMAWEVRMDSTHVTFLSFSPDGARLAASSGDGTIRVLATASGATWRVLMGHSGPVYGVAYAGPDRLVSVGADGVRVWDPAATDGLDVFRVHRSYEEGNRYPYVYSVTTDPRGRRVFSGGWDRTIRITDLATGEPLASLACPDAAPQRISFGPGRLAAAWPGLFVYDLDTLATVHAEPRERKPTYGAAVFAPDGARLLVTERPGDVRLLDARTLEVVATWEGALADAASWLPDGAGVAGIDGPTVWIRDARDGALLAAVACGGSLRGLAVSPDGRRLAAAGTDDVVYVIDARTARIVHRMEGHTETVYALAFDPASRRLATGADDNTIRIWDVARGRELLVLDGHTSYVFGLAFTPDGSALLSASGDNTVRVWSTVPYAERVAAARARRALWSRLADRADALAREHGDGAVRAARAATGLSDDEREALVDLLWKRRR